MAHQIQSLKSLRWPLIAPHSPQTRSRTVPMPTFPTWPPVLEFGRFNILFLPSDERPRWTGCISTHFIVSGRSDSVGFHLRGKYQAERLQPLVAAWWISLWAWPCDCASLPVFKRWQTTVRLPSTCSSIELFSFPLICQCVRVSVCVMVQLTRRREWEKAHH